MTAKSQIGTPLAHLARIVLLITAQAVLACGSDRQPTLNAGDASGPAADTASPGADAATTCQAPNVVSYPAPGCGAAAPRVCSAPQLDACAVLSFYCGCDGKTTVTGGYNWSDEPYLYSGPCRDGGASDGP